MPETRLHSRLEGCYQRGLRLVKEGNYDYAHEMFVQCVLHAPSNVVYTEAMLKNLREMHFGQKKKSPFSLGKAGSRVLKKTVGRSDWKCVLRQGVDLLKTNPWDVATLRAVAMACEALHYNEVELVYLKQALDADPKNIEVNCHCARSLGRMGQFDQAIACWHRVETLQGKNEEAARMISQLAEDKLRYPGGIPPTPAVSAPVKVVAVDQPQATASAVEPSLTPRQLLEFTVGYNPWDERSHLQLADELIASKAYEEAERSLQQALIVCDGSPLLIEKLEQVRILLAQRRQTQAEAALHANEQSAEEELRIPWLELLLGAAILALVVQFFPAIGTMLRQALDLRNWGRGTWFVANLLILLFLCCLRFAPELIRTYRKKRARS